MKNKIHWAIAACAAIVVLAACSGRKMNADLNLFAKVASACTAGDTCSVDLGLLVSEVEWDRMAFVRMQGWAQDIPQAVGCEPFQLEEFQDVILFLQGKEVAARIDRDYDPEVAFANTVFLEDWAEPVHWKVFARADCKFQAIRDRSGGNENFDLRPVAVQP